MSCYSSNVRLVRGFSNKYTMECKQFFEKKSRWFQTRLQSRNGFDYQRPAGLSTGFLTNTCSTSTVCRKPLAKVISSVLSLSCVGLEIKLRLILKDTEMINQRGLR